MCIYIYIYVHIYTHTCIDVHMCLISARRRPAEHARGAHARSLHVETVCCLLLYVGGICYFDLHIKSAIVYCRTRARSKILLVIWISCSCVLCIYIYIYIYIYIDVHMCLISAHRRPAEHARGAKLYYIN